MDFFTALLSVRIGSSSAMQSNASSSCLFLD